MKFLLSQYNISFQKFPENSVVLFQDQPEETTLFGVIVDSSSKNNLSGANIFLKEDRHIGTTSDENGIFRIENVPARLCTLMVYYIGYEPVEYIKSQGENKPVYLKLTSPYLYWHL